jgi:type VI protein secretion system component VasF
MANDEERIDYGFGPETREEQRQRQQKAQEEFGAWMAKWRAEIKRNEDVTRRLARARPGNIEQMLGILLSVIVWLAVCGGILYGLVRFVKWALEG